ncbi:Asp/Glu/hydantoin racemase [Sphingobacterium sp. SGG-5]|uniref:glutamate racemase n=1 Tax=Sphingobacterium sp. SGG-5 TaxID=2710881 RepID=UPI0013EA0E0D|nr:aspartate/glutamate racemase family protein [Sphingobacterium sp. SGG-5]NGM61312.1 Asp/Glu/hydantoin racemase [Sphingobacterium sp. SGG-5]
MRKLNFAFLALLSGSMVSCFQQKEEKKETALLPIEEAILRDSSSFYFIDFGQYPTSLKELPIGVFDSGTGGLTVLDAIVRFDEYNNADKHAGADGVVDFRQEDFIYLADQANMPYGNYDATNKTDLLQEHIIKDFQFLFGDKYYTSADAETWTTKKPVKAIVVACNTATAYGYKEAVEFVKKAGVDVPIIGVINAAVRGTLSQFDKKDNGSIGVFATVGTIASEGYERTIREAMKEQGYTGNLQIVNQGGHGLAEAVDGEADYINRKIDEPRDSYRGPALDNDKYKIEKEFLSAYNFNFEGNQMLCDTKNADDCNILQINSPENYVRYHLVSMMNNLRSMDNPQPLKALILGCTHYPYMIKEINLVLHELRDFQDKNKAYPYRDLISDEVHIIDPSIYVARELFDVLKERQLFNNNGDMLANSEFFISVPNTSNKNVQLDSMGRFTYDYKYGRNAGEIQEYVKSVPFDNQNIPKETLDRFRQVIPETFTLIRNFSQHQANSIK